MVKVQDKQEALESANGSDLADGALPRSAQKKQSIDQLTARYNALNTRKIQAETNLQNAEKELKKLKAKALQEYKTDDVSELREKLQEMETENERKRSEYQQNLEKIEADLKVADEKYAAAKGAKEEQK